MSFLTSFRKALPVAMLPLAMGVSFLTLSSEAFSAPVFKSGLNTRSTALFRKAGLLNSNVTTRTIVLPPARGTATSAVSASSVVKAAASDSLTFTFQGYTGTQSTEFSTYLSRYLGQMQTLWGLPAPEQRGKNVVIQGDSFDAAYEPPAVNSVRPGGTIYFRYNNSDTPAGRRYNLTRLIFLSFWGAHIPSYEFAQARYVEPWIFGMSDAAAMQIAYQVAGSPSNFNPTALDSYLLPVYDFFNRPELSNAYVYPPNLSSETDPIIALSDVRRTMAQAAFLKVAAENPNFYSLFNSAYYTATQARKPVTPETLKSIAAGVVPTVEGTAFRDWARRQYVLDASVTTGQKLYFAIIPLAAATSGDTRSGFSGIAQAFTTDAQGNEFVSTGYGSIQALSDAGVDISANSSELKSSNILDFSQTGFEGQGYNGKDSGGTPTFGAGFSAGADKSRIAIKIRFKEAEATNYLPYGVTGTTNSSSSFYGATLGADSGALTIGSENATVSRGAFKTTTVSTPGPAVKTQITFNGTTLRRNTAWLVPNEFIRSNGFLLEVPPANNNINFSVAGGTSRLRMVSFPLVPSKTDEAQMLGVTPETLELARYRPNLSPATVVGDALQFGIDTQRHEIYPYISQGVAPGRGYWLATGVSGFSATIQGGEPSRSKPYEVPLLGGWNQIGVPFNRDFAPGAVKVRYGGFAPVSLAVAQSRGWIAPGIWRWLPGGEWERADDEGSGNLKAFEGYYIFANPARGVSLVFEVGAEAAKLAKRTGWNVALLVSGAKNRDSSTRFGISSDSNIAKPPVATRFVTFRFVDGSGDAAASTGAGLAESYQPVLSGIGTWTAILDGTTSGERIIISWGALGTLPKKVTLTLRDEKTGQSLKMTKNGRYNFTSDGKPRRFTFTATSADSSSKAKSSSTSVSKS